MNETSVTQEILHTGLFLIIGSALVLAGWNEPLRYLFMQQEKIAAEEMTMFAPVDDSPRKPFASSLQGTALDRAPYRTYKDGTVEYSSNFDTRRMGTRTESERKDNMYNRKK